jgi:ParB/RepB/Spo0J family partition protein
VYRVGNRYRLIAGERRLHAARMLGWTEIAAMVREASDDHLLLELIENTQRKWLTDAEEADALIRLVREMGHEGKEVAAQAGRSVAYVSKRIRVFEDACLREAIERKELNVSIAEELLALPVDERPALVAQAIAGDWDGRRVREVVRARLEPAPDWPSVAEPAPEFSDPEPVPAADPWATEPEPVANRSAAAQAVLTLVEDVLDEADASENALPDPPLPQGIRRHSNLARAVRSLTELLRDVRPYELTPVDERALATLLHTLLRLARAHAGEGRSGIVFPSVEEAERKARRR